MLLRVEVLSRGLVVGYLNDGCAGVLERVRAFHLGSFFLSSAVLSSFFDSCLPVLSTSILVREATMSDEELSKKGGTFGEHDDHIKVDNETGEETVIADDGEVVASIDPVAERKLVWKFDLRILPVLAVMYLFNSLDKR
jgi:hypothetical protein